MPWFSGLAILLELIESTGTKAVLPDSTPLGQRPLRRADLRLCTGCGLSFGLDICGTLLEGSWPTSVYSLGNSLSWVQVAAGRITGADIEQVLGWYW